MSVLAAWLAPWLAAGVIALHMEGHADGHEPADHHVVAAALHGHHHDAGTPEHDHVLTVPAAAHAQVNVSLAPLPPIAVRALAEAIAAPALLGGSAAVAAPGHDPPSPQRSFSILRI